MSPTEAIHCPVTGCPNDRDSANGHLCWRHRQFVRPATIKAIKQAWSTLQRNIGSALESEHRGYFNRAVSAACAEATKVEAAIKATQVGSP